MATEQYSIGYEEGFQNGWNTAVDAKPEQPAQHEPVAWMHEWEDGERIPMLTGRDDRNTDEPISVRPLVYADTSPPAQRKPLTPEWYAQWIRNNYQDYWNIATLCDEMTKAAHNIKENT